MAQPPKVKSLSPSDLKTVRSLTKEYVAEGLATLAATHKAVATMMEETQEALNSVYRQAAPDPEKAERNIGTSFRQKQTHA